MEHNRWWWLLAVVLATLALASGPARAELEVEVEQEEPEDSMTRAIAVVWPDPELPPAGFERTHQALNTIFEETTAPDLEGTQLAKPLAYAKQTSISFLAACQLDRAKCLTVFDQISELRLKHVSGDNKNLAEYLATCEEVQNEFCQGVGSDKRAKERAWASVQKRLKRGPANKKNFFEKLVTVCWPKCEREQEAAA